MDLFFFLENSQTRMPTDYFHLESLSNLCFSQSETKPPCRCLPGCLGKKKKKSSEVAGQTAKLKDAISFVCGGILKATT